MNHKNSIHRKGSGEFVDACFAAAGIFLPDPNEVRGDAEHKKAFAVHECSAGKGYRSGGCGTQIGGCYGII